MMSAAQEEGSNNGGGLAEGQESEEEEMMDPGTPAEGMRSSSTRLDSAQLYDECSNGGLKRVRQLLEGKADPNWQHTCN